MMALATADESASRQGLTQLAFSWLSTNTDIYEAVQTLLADERERLILAIHEFDAIVSNRRFTQKYAQQPKAVCNCHRLFAVVRVLHHPLVYLSACEEAFRRLYETIASQSVNDASKFAPANELCAKPRLGVRGWLGNHTVTPRGLTCRLVNKLVCLVGIVTRCSLVHPKLSRSVHVADESLYAVTRRHRDAASLAPDTEIADGAAINVPKVDNDGHPLEIEVGLCEYNDFQRITLQEMPECAPTGQLPRSVDVLLEDDLVDKCKPGDRLRIWGVYRCIATRENSRLTGHSSTFVVANNVEQLRADLLSPEISPVDLRFMRDLAQRPDTFDLLSQSIAPALCGHDLVKKGLLLQLLGGERKQLTNGMRLRGDIHILLIGDPSCGKSQLLRFMMNLAPLALSTTGRGSTGVGLTAAVSSDKDTGERKLEAGAMVLGDGGLVCIDEFDKMTTEDRVAIHEVLEQQTVSISKAGIQTVLNARTSVLAAANPIYGCFDPDVNLKSQINFPDSLLTRFDLIFIVRDAQTAEDDRRIASQVLQQLRLNAQNMNRQRNSAVHTCGVASVDEESGVLQPLVLRQQDQRDNGPSHWDSYYEPAGPDGRPRQKKVVSVSLLHKLIHYVKHTRAAPVLTDASINCISEFYAHLRQVCAGGATGAPRRKTHVIPTARTLEACVRLATAHARLKLKDTVDVEDALAIQKLLLYALIGEVPEGYNKNGVRIEPVPAPLALGNNTIEPDNKQINRKRLRRPPVDEENSTEPRPTSKRRSMREVENDDAFSALDDTASQKSIESIESTQLEINPKKLKLLMSAIQKAKTQHSGDSIALEVLRATILAGSEKLTREEVDAGLLRLQAGNKLMIVSGEVWFV